MGARWRVAAFGVALALALLATAEAALRLAGIGIEPALIEATGTAGPLLIRRPSAPGVDPAALARAPDRLGCSASKPAGTIRIIVVGESTVAGFPFHGQLSFARLLEHALDAGGAGAVEVVNFGRAADSSDDVRESALAALALAPDVLLVSSGHNEFQASYVGALRDGIWPRVRAALRSLALVRAGQQREWRTAAAEEEARSPEAVADAPFLAESEFARGAERYRANLLAIARAADRAGVRLALMTQVSNLAVAPCASSFRQLRDPSARARYRRELMALQAAPAPEAPAELARRCAAADALIAEDAGVALAQFVAARCHAALGDDAAARSRYQAALLLDDYPNRGGARLNGMIREVARDCGAALVDVEAAFLASGGAAPAHELFLDYCHPNLAGVAALARGCVATLAEKSWLPPALDRARVDALLTGPVEDWLGDLALSREGLASGLAQAALDVVRAAEAAADPREPWRLAAGGCAQALTIAPTLVDAELAAIALAAALGNVEESLARADKLWRSNPEALQKLASQLAAFPRLAAAIADAGLVWRDRQLVRKS